ncbi:hypothetical protein IVB03_03635 [Bradyrhizobium sp. 168]|uniref:hypothetical protein n=1 Tax=Bradyrhizobium sp. 168 TaxID=2782639 RepID=UPI001FF8568A|nr:hypothetical protein [Bradyrhizobium sp. 168]MCK1578699.1 hypothetical protein [Bradyrhizobium sp. 168]
MPDKRKKSKYEIELLDEKRAFVVVALTGKLNLAGKAAAANALAHYDSRKGYAYASVETMAREAGYAPTSTKTLNRGLTEIHEIGAFSVKRTRGGAKNTHHMCPNMAWFRAEYELLRKSRKLDDDEFADIRDVEGDRPGSQPEINNPGSELENTGSELDNSGSQLSNRGSEPDEEDCKKKTLEKDQKKTIKGVPAAARSGQFGHSDVADDAQCQNATNDNVKQDDADLGAKVAPWPVDMYQKFMDIYPKGGNPMKIKRALDRIEREGRTDYRLILKGASNYKREKEGTQSQFISDPANFLRDGVYEGYQKEPPSRYKRTAAI